MEFFKRYFEVSAVGVKLLCLVRLPHNEVGRNDEGESRKSKGGYRHDDSHRRQKPAVHRRGHGSVLGTPGGEESVLRQRGGEVQLRLSAGIRREAGLRTARGALQALQRSQHQ